MHGSLTPPLAPTSPEADGALEGIKGAFFSALDRESSGPLAALWVAVAVAAAIVVFRYLRELRVDAARRRAAEALHEAATREADAHPDRRAWVRVPAHRTMTVTRLDAADRAHFETFETQNISAGGIAFLSHRDMELGERIRFELDIGEQRPLTIHGIVVRVEPVKVPAAPSLVALKLGPVDASTREHLQHWIAAEEVREIAEAHRGRLCAHCHRPLADSAVDEMHATCARLEDRHSVGS